MLCNLPTTKASESLFGTSQLCSLVSAFSDRQRCIAQDMGLKFILSLPAYKSMSVEFVSWLYSRIRIGVSGSLSLDPGANRPAKTISIHDVEHIFALPVEGNVLLLGPPRKGNLDLQKVSSMLCCGRGLKGSAVNIHRAAVALSQSVGRPMNDADEDEFATAVLVYTVGAILAPRGKGKSMDASVVQVARRARRAGEYNWGDYILKAIASVVPDVQMQLSCRGLLDVEFGGCCLLLQVYCSYFPERITIDLFLFLSLLLPFIHSFAIHFPVPYVVLSQFHVFVYTLFCVVCVPVYIHGCSSHCSSRRCSTISHIYRTSSYLSYTAA